MAHTRAVKDSQIVCPREILNSTDTVAMLPDGCWFQPSTLALRLKVDCVPDCGSEEVVPDFANSSAGDGVVQIGEAAYLDPQLK